MPALERSELNGEIAGCGTYHCPALDFQPGTLFDQAIEVIVLTSAPHYVETAKRAARDLAKRTQNLGIPRGQAREDNIGHLRRLLGALGNRRVPRSFQFAVDARGHVSR